MKPFTVGACLAATVSFAAALKTETINGYAEFRRGDTLMVEGQRVVATSTTTLKGGQQVAAFGGQLGLSALMTGYSRDYEDQADRVGLRYVYEAGFDPTKGPALWQKFKEKYGETDSRPTERIRNLQRQIQLNYTVSKST